MGTPQVCLLIAAQNIGYEVVDVVSVAAPGEAKRSMEILLAKKPGCRFRGRIQSSSGLPLGAAFVSLHRIESLGPQTPQAKFFGEANVRGVTNEEGEFELHGFPSGHYQAEASIFGAVYWRETIEFKPNEDINRVVVHATKPMGIKAEVSVLSNGRAVSSIGVFLPGVNGTTGPSGKITFSRLPKGGEIKLHLSGRAQLLLMFNRTGPRSIEHLLRTALEEMLSAGSCPAGELQSRGQQMIELTDWAQEWDCSPWEPRLKGAIRKAGSIVPPAIWRLVQAGKVRQAILGFASSGLHCRR